MVIALLIAMLFPLLGAPANVTKADVIVPLPTISGLPLPLPLPSQVKVPLPGPTAVVPQPVKSVNVPRVVPTPNPFPSSIQPPVIVPGPTKTTIITRPDGTRVQVITRTVPGPVRTVIKTVPTPVPGPTKTVFTEKFSPGQTKIIHDKVNDAKKKFGLLGLVAGMLLAFVAVVLVYYRGFRKGEIHDAKLLRDTI